MADNDSLAERFDQNRGHLRGVAYRMLGSLAEADDAVQDAWLRLSRSGGSSVDNLGGEGNFDALMSLLDPNIVLRADHRVLGRGGPAEIRDAAAIAERAVKGGARAAQPALIDGEVGVVVAPRGRLLMVLKFTVVDGKIVEMEAIADRDRLRQLDLAVLG